MTTTLSEYYDKLARADWFYEMSDDHSVWLRGQVEFGKLQSIAKESPEHAQLYEEFKKHMFSPWKTKEDGSFDYDAGREVPKPERPTEKVFRTGESNG